MFNITFIFIAKCSQIKCKNGGTCEIKNGKAACTCPDNYTGEYCQTGKEKYKYIYLHIMWILKMHEILL